MTMFNVTLPSGKTWTPTFMQSINEDKCIGCTACAKLCPNECYTHAAAPATA